MASVRILCRGMIRRSFRLPNKAGQPVSDNEFRNFVKDIQEVVCKQVVGSKVYGRSHEKVLYVEIIDATRASAVSDAILDSWKKAQAANKRAYAERDVIVAEATPAGPKSCN